MKLCQTALCPEQEKGEEARAVDLLEKSKPLEMFEDMSEHA